MGGVFDLARWTLQLRGRSVPCVWVQPCIAIMVSNSKFLRQVWQVPSATADHCHILPRRSPIVWLCASCCLMGSYSVGGSFFKQDQLREVDKWTDNCTQYAKAPDLSHQAMTRLARPAAYIPSPSSASLQLRCYCRNPHRQDPALKLPAQAPHCFCF